MITIQSTFRKPNDCKASINKESFSDGTVLSEDDHDDDHVGGDGYLTPPPRPQQQQQQLNKDRCCCAFSPARTKVGVSFHSVQVREYNRVLGDWLDVSNGLAIGWNYTQHEPLLLPKLQKESYNHRTKHRNDRPLHNILQRLRLTTTTKTKKAAFCHARTPTMRTAAVGSKIRALSFRDASRGTSPSKRNNYNDYDKTPTTSRQRVEILKQFGFSSEELERVELQRERTKFERYLIDSMPRNTNTTDCE